MKAALLVLLFASARASSAGGSWSQLTPGGAAGPAGRTWHNGASCGSAIYVAGGTSQEHVTTIRYRDAGNIFEDVEAPLPHAFFAADMDCVGGVLVIFGGKNHTSGLLDDELFYLSTTETPGATWQQQQFSNKPPARDDHTLVAMSGVLYLFGGWDTTKYFNDLWAFETGRVVTGSAIAWQQLKPNSPSSVLVPAPRNGHTMVAVGSQLVLFGGFSHLPELGSMHCTATEQAQNKCKFYEDVWLMEDPSVVSSSPSWRQVVPHSSTTTGGRPAARFGHSAVAIGDCMFIYGGKTASLAITNDVWQLHVPTNRWTQLASAPQASWLHAAATIGGQMYVFGGTGAQGYWRFSPPMAALADESGGGSSEDAAKAAAAEEAREEAEEEEEERLEERLEESEHAMESIIFGAMVVVVVLQIAIITMMCRNRRGSGGASGRGRGASLYTQVDDPLQLGNDAL
eukprot:g1731.t1